MDAPEPIDPRELVPAGYGCCFFRVSVFGPEPDAAILWHVVLWSDAGAMAAEMVAPGPEAPSIDAAIAYIQQNGKDAYTVLPPGFLARYPRHLWHMLTS